MVHELFIAIDRKVKILPNESLLNLKRINKTGVEILNWLWSRMSFPLNALIPGNPLKANLSDIWVQKFKKKVLFFSSLRFLNQRACFVFYPFKGLKS